MNTGTTNGFFPLHHGSRRHDENGNGASWLGVPYWDDDGYLWDQSSYQEPANTTAPQPQVILVESKEPRTTARPPEPPKLIEVPQPADAPAARPQPPALFVLKNGERLESRDYLLTSQSLQIEVGRQHRTIPLSGLDLDATIAANHQRGIDVTIPRSSNTVYLGF